MRSRAARGGTLVLGGGFAGGYIARLLGAAGATIVSPENFMLYTPLLPEAASGTLEPRHVVVPLRVMCPHAELLLGQATALDEDARLVRIETHDGEVEVSFDSRFPALRSTLSASSRSPTRSTCAITCSASSKRPRQARRTPSDT
jgi:NADH dehydrogenase